MSKTRSPSYGLRILEELSIQFPNHQGIKSSLTNAYIRFGQHDTALEMIADIPNDKTDVHSLKFKAWQCHKNGDIEQEQSIWDSILSKNFHAQIENKISTFIQRSQTNINLSKEDIPLFCVERNEMLRLPFFLDYYRQLGVTQFIFIDNNSDDGSLEFLLNQPDCHVFWTNDSYNESGHGLTWLNYLINKDNFLHTDQWYIIADADEFLVYPECENQKLLNLISYLNSTEESEVVPSFMMDMYPKKLGDTNFDTNNFLQKHIYFYSNYQTFYQIESPYINITGGVRQALFTEYNNYSVKTALFKKMHHACTLLSSTHQTSPQKTSRLTTVFLHYKFSGNFKEISAVEIKRKQHSGGASRYRHYHDQLNAELYTMDLSKLSKSTKYQNSQQLVDLGLINCPDDWKNFVKMENNNNE